MKTQSELLNKIYKELCLFKSDINEHLPTLYEYSKQSESIVELGVRTVVSTFSFLAGQPKSFTCVDIINPNVHPNSLLPQAERIAKELNIHFKFIKSKSCDFKFESVDFLFIDTHHDYRLLKEELSVHGNNVNKFIAFHDTTLFEYKNEGNVYPDDEKKGLWPAIEEFLDENKNWKIRNRYYNNNGLTILERV